MPEGKYQERNGKGSRKQNRKKQHFWLYYNEKMWVYL